MMTRAHGTIAVLCVALVALLAHDVILARRNHDLARSEADAALQVLYLSDLFRRADERRAAEAPAGAPEGTLAARAANHAPPFALPAPDGRSAVTTLSLRGGPAAVIAFTAAAGARFQAELAALHAGLAARGVNLVGIIPDSCRVARELVSVTKLSFPIGAQAPAGLFYQLAADEPPRVIPLDKRGVMLEPLPPRLVPSAAAVLDRLGYEELVAPDAALARVRATGMDGARRLEPIAVDGVFLSWFRVLDAMGALLGYAKFAHPDVGCPLCQDPKLLVTLDRDGVVDQVVLLDPMVVGVERRTVDASGLLHELRAKAHEHLRAASGGATPDPDAFAGVKVLAGATLSTRALAEAFVDLEHEWARLEKGVR